MPNELECKREVIAARYIGWIVEEKKHIASMEECNNAAARCAANANESRKELMAMVGQNISKRIIRTDNGYAVLIVYGGDKTTVTIFNDNGEPLR